MNKNAPVILALAAVAAYFGWNYLKKQQTVAAAAKGITPNPVGGNVPGAVPGSPASFFAPNVLPNSGQTSSNPLSGILNAAANALGLKTSGSTLGPHAAPHDTGSSPGLGAASNLGPNSGLPGSNLGPYNGSPGANNNSPAGNSIFDPNSNTWYDATTGEVVGYGSLTNGSDISQGALAYNEGPYSNPTSTDLTAIDNGYSSSGTDSPSSFYDYQDTSGGGGGGTDYSSVDTTGVDTSLSGFDSSGGDYSSYS